MSLLDALLLDPVRINVWIAKRTDGIAGSGTQNDPYDGSSLAKFDEIMRKLSEYEEKICVNVTVGACGNMSCSSRRKEALILTLQSALSTRHLFETPYVVSYGPQRWRCCRAGVRKCSRPVLFLIITPLQRGVADCTRRSNGFNRFPPSLSVRHPRKPLKRLRRHPRPPNTLLKQGVNETSPHRGFSDFNNAGPPSGIMLFAQPLIQDFTIKGFRVFRKVVIRNNIIRYVDNLNEDHLHPHEANIGISLTVAEDAIVENNIIDLGRLDPIQYRDCTSVHYFNNTTPAGKLITGTRQPPLIAGVPQYPAKDLSVLVGDSLLLSIL